MKYILKQSIYYEIKITRPKNYQGYEPVPRQRKQRHRSIIMECKLELTPTEPLDYQHFLKEYAEPNTLQQKNQ